jgi:hypothetical protein
VQSCDNRHILRRNHHVGPSSEFRHWRCKTNVRYGPLVHMVASNLDAALPPKADMCTALAHVCFGPKADIMSFDHLVGG